MAADASAQPRTGRPVTRFLGAAGRSREATLVWLIALLSILVTLQAPQFLSASNLGQVTTFAAIIAVAAVGEAVVVITRNIDLSVESTIGLIAFVVADVLQRHWLGVPEVWIFGLLLALGLGMVNGAIITIFQVPSIVVTLGTLTIYRGIVFFVAGGHQVNVVDLPPGYSSPATSTLLGIPVFVLVAVAVVVVAALVLRYTRAGRRFYAVGSDPEAASIAGIRVRWVVFLAFAISGLLAGVAGIMWGIYFGTIYATSASGLILQIVAAVVVGGVAIGGGSGTVVGAALGALFLALINNALLLLQLPQELLQVIYGAVILIAVATDSIVRQRAQRASAGVVAR
jgi:rhamnose transport system permease protein